MNTQREKFQFDTDFQQEILQFTVTDPKNGFKALELFETEYFTLIPHVVIAETLKKYYAKKFLIPSLPVLKEEVRQLLRRKQWQELVHTDDKEKVFKILKKIYLRPVRDPDTIYIQCRSFARYSALKDELENINLLDYDSYLASSEKITKAVHKGTDLNQRKSLLLFRDAKIRGTRRLDEPGGNPTPWWQLNALTNSGGTTPGNIIVILSEAKFFKTGFLVNTALGYTKMGKCILYVDLENGEKALSTRADQVLMNQDRQMLTDPGNLPKFLKMIRKWKRFGGEVAILRLPAGSTANDIKKEKRRLWDEEGILITDMICDYPDLMGAIDGTSAETEKISKVYIDLKNLAEEEEIQTIWCPSHVNREGSKDGKGKRYEQVHLAKALDKIRHADMIWSMVQDEEEAEANIIRLELTAQRDGVQNARIWFWANLAKQKLREFNKVQAKQANEDFMERHKPKKKDKEEPYTPPANKKKVADI